MAKGFILLPGLLFLPLFQDRSSNPQIVTEAVTLHVPSTVLGQGNSVVNRALTAPKNSQSHGGGSLVKSCHPEKRYDNDLLAAVGPGASH